MERTREAVRTLHPAYFALVMATGIVSIGMSLNGRHTVSDILMWTAVGCYAVLVGLTVWRLTAFRADMADDFADPRRAFGFFTFVAGTDVVGTRLAAQGYLDAAVVLMVVGWVGWMLLGYVVPWTAILGRTERPILAAANGTWFVWVVASQSVAVLAATLEPQRASGRGAFALLAVFCWAVGALLYAGVGIMVSARMLLYPVGPEDLTPPYWISMGATAITVVAGARIVEMANAPMVDATRGLVAGVSVVFWVFGSWLIPALVAAGWWRHRTHRIPLRYEPAFWSVVFPLGMYGVAGRLLGDADNLREVADIGRWETWVGLIAWVLVFAAMVHHLVTLYGLRSRPRPRLAPPA